MLYTMSTGSNSLLTHVGSLSAGGIRTDVDIDNGVVLGI